MTTVAEPAEPLVRLADEQRLLLRGVGWLTYRAISDTLNDSPVRVTFDRGNLELMTKSLSHGGYSRLLFRLIAVLTEEMGLPLASCGDMTCDREDLQRGLEPDECFYLENE